jgi:hypothetical protein
MQTLNIISVPLIIYTLLILAGIYCAFQSQVGAYRGKVALVTDPVEATAISSMWHTMAIKAAYRERIAGVDTNRELSTYRIAGCYVTRCDIKLLSGRVIEAYLQVTEDSGTPTKPMAPSARMEVVCTK